MRKANHSSQQVESALPDIRLEFFERLSRTKNGLSITGLTDRLRDKITANRDFFQAWIKGLRHHATDDLAQPKLDALARRLDERRDWAEAELLALLGKKPNGILPSLVGFSLMRVSPNYREIYYTDIISEILPKHTIDFIKSSVSVPRKGGGWAGSVGVAVSEGRCLVPSSFRDARGVVASEDLLGGNVSILMRSVYADPNAYEQGRAIAHNPDKVGAAAFCFFPLPEIFVEGDLEVFSESVDFRSYSLRTYCEQRDAQGNRNRLTKLMQETHEDEGDTELNLLRTLITPGTQNNPVGAVLGIYTSVDDEKATIRSLAVCEDFVERQHWFPDFIGTHPRISMSTKLSFALGKEGCRWAIFTLVFRGPVGLSEGDYPIPEAVLEPFERLWSVLADYSGPPVLSDSQRDPTLTADAEPLKIAADMMLATISLMLTYFSMKLSGEVVDNRKESQIVGNIQQILELGRVYFHWESSCTRSFLDALRDWLIHLRSATAAGFVLVVGRVLGPDEVGLTSNAKELWPNTARLSKISSVNWYPWLADLFGVHGSEIPPEDLLHSADCLGTHLNDFSDSFVNKLGAKRHVSIRLPPGEHKKMKGIFRLCSVAPMIGYDSEEIKGPTEVAENEIANWTDIPNPIINLVTSYYSSLLLERDKAEAEKQSVLARFARGASHGLKNALAVPPLVIKDPIAKAKGILPKLMVLPSPMYTTLQQVIEASEFVMEELRHLQNQAELFFWVMDEKKGRKQIEDRAMGAKPIRLDTIISKAFLRGTYLTVMDRLRPEELERAMPKSRDSSRMRGDALRQRLSQPLVDANQGHIWDALTRVKFVFAQNTNMDLELPEETADLQVEGIDIPLLDAVLMELLQNATKAAFLSASEIEANGKRPFVHVVINRQGDGILIKVNNSAKESDCKKLLTDNESARSARLENPVDIGSGGIQGIWQIRMLCDQLSGGRLKLGEEPTIGDGTVSFPLVWRPGVK